MGEKDISIPVLTLSFICKKMFRREREKKVPNLAQKKKKNP